MKTYTGIKGDSCMRRNDAVAGVMPAHAGFSTKKWGVTSRKQTYDGRPDGTSLASVLMRKSLSSELRAAALVRHVRKKSLNSLDILPIFLYDFSTLNVCRSSVVWLLRIERNGSFGYKGDLWRPEWLHARTLLSGWDGSNSGFYFSTNLDPHFKNVSESNRHTFIPRQRENPFVKNALAKLSQAPMPMLQKYECLAH